MSFRYYYSGEYELKQRTIYVRTGEFRPPKKGEWYLSGAIPRAYKALNDLTSPYHIMRPATEEETHCQCCKQLLPIQGE
jgi:hypothetical protein